MLHIFFSHKLLDQIFIDDPWYFYEIERSEGKVAFEDSCFEQFYDILLD